MLLWVNLYTGYWDNNKIGVTFWKFAKTLVQNWEMNLTRIKDIEMKVKMRVSCDLCEDSFVSEMECGLHMKELEVKQRIDE